MLLAPAMRSCVDLLEVVCHIQLSHACHAPVMPCHVFRGRSKNFKTGGGGGGGGGIFFKRGGGGGGGIFFKKRGGGVQPLTREQFVLQIFSKRGGGGRADPLDTCVCVCMSCMSRTCVTWQPHITCHMAIMCLSAVCHSPEPWLENPSERPWD